MEFKPFADIINAKFMKMAEKPLYKANTPVESIWEAYQAAFPTEANKIFRERRVHECNTCNSFIKRLGAVVTIEGDKLDTIWNVKGLASPYKEVAATLHKIVSKSAISSVFLTDESLVGKEFNIEPSTAGDIKWEHFYATIPASFVVPNVATLRGEIDTTVSVFKRALTEFSVETLELVSDLCNTIYRGTEYKATVDHFLTLKKEYDVSKQSLYIWENYTRYPTGFRTSAIGTLIQDLMADKDTVEAVNSYGAKVDPANFKRVTSVATPKQREEALKFIDDNGMRDSLPRRAAVLEDISTTNVLFVNNDAKMKMKDPLAELLATTSKPKAKVSATTQEIHIDDFLSTVLPHSSNIEALVENKHTANFVSLVAPQHPTAPNMLKWGNNFSWSYAGEMTDSSLTKRVEAAGGRTDGAFRFTHSWNELEPNQSLMDLHVFMPGCVRPTTGGGPAVIGRRVGWNCREDTASGGKQDVDYTSAAPKDYIPVENITFPTLSKMPDGVYTCKVHNWSFRNTGGKGRAEIAFNGKKFEYVYPSTKNHQWVTVAEVTLKNGEFSIEHKLPLAAATPTSQWDVSTMSYQKVSTVMLSPNFWDGQTVGNKHFFFMLDGCKNPDPIRGFYNEFLSDSFRDHRKTFELLSSAMKCEPSDEQLSGLGFSSTQRNDLHVKVDGRPYKIIF